MTSKPALPFPFPHVPGARDLRRFANQPAAALGVLGIVSGLVATWLQGPVIGEVTQPPPLLLYMPLVGIWFGLVVGYGAWRWGERGWRAPLSAFAGTWIGWEAAANLAIQIDQSWLKGTDLAQATLTWIEAPLAGALGALLTWAGIAAAVPALRRAAPAFLIVASGTLAGLMLPSAMELDNAALLFVPWQGLVGAVIGACLARAPAPSAWPARN